MTEKMSRGLLEWVKIILVALIIAVFLKFFLIELVWVNGASMEPTLNNNNGLVVNRFAYNIYSPSRGDVVIIRHSEKDSYVKRIVGISGDTILIKNDKFYLNGEPQNEPYIKDFTGGFYGPIKVPENSIFVMGDNRNDSTDSRSPDLGTVSNDRIIGKVVLRVWPFTNIRVF